MTAVFGITSMSFDKLLTLYLSEGTMIFTALLLIAAIITFVKVKGRKGLRATCIAIGIYCILYLGAMIALSFLFGSNHEPAPEAPPISSTNTLAEATVTGYFTATVRDVIPDYCFDDTTPMVAVVTCFQSTPFTVKLGDELTSQVKPEETYNFEIFEKKIQIKQESIEKAFPSPEIAIPLYGLRIASVTIASEADYGLDASHFVVEQNG